MIVVTEMYNGIFTRMLDLVLEINCNWAVGVSGIPELIILNAGDYADPSLLKTVTFT